MIEELFNEDNELQWRFSDSTQHPKEFRQGLGLISLPIPIGTSHDTGNPVLHDFHYKSTSLSKAVSKLSITILQMPFDTNCQIQA